MSRISSAASATYTSRALIARGDAGIKELSAADWYKLMMAYYQSNGLYTDLEAALHDAGIWNEAMKPLRNPAFRVAEFYASKLWPGALSTALPIVTENERIIPAIEQIWEWSNWARKKQVAARWFAIYGDMFIKVAQRVGPDGKPARVYMQLLRPQRVINFDSDERDYLTYIRIDTPRIRRGGDKIESFTHVELWDKSRNRFAIWEHDGKPGKPLSRLGRPIVDSEITDFGIDFIPIAHGKFRDLGEDDEDGQSRSGRGSNAFGHALDKIDEANRQATRLHQMFYRYNNVTEVVEGDATDPTGRPLAPPRVRGKTTSTDDGTLAVGDSRIVRLPSGWHWREAVPKLDYAAGLSILNAHMLEIEKDLPELAYYRLRDMSDISGRAVRLLLGDAIDRALEARGNGEATIIQAHQMALTIGQIGGLFDDIGDYAAGDYRHEFAARPVIDTPEAERADVAEKYVRATVPLAAALRRAGWTEDEIDGALEEQARARASEIDFAKQMRSDAERAFNGGAPE